MLTARRSGAAFAPPRGLPGVALAALGIVALAAEQGGYFAPAWRFGAAAFAAAAALLWLWSDERVPRLALAPPALLAAFAAWSAASAAWSVSSSASLLDVQRTLLYTAAALAFVFAGEGLVLGVGAGGTIVAGWALAARLIDGSTWDRYEGTSLTGPLGYANGLAALVGIAAVVWLALALERRRPALLAPLAVLLPALALTESRGAIGATVAGAAVAILARRRQLALAVAGAAGVLLTVLLAVPQIAPADRAPYWQAARHLAAANPFAGTGAGTFGLLYHGALPGRDAHSLYLQAFAELGVVGLVLIVALFALPLAVALRRRLAAPAAGLTVYLLAAGVDWDWQLPAVTIAALALAVASFRTRRA